MSLKLPLFISPALLACTLTSCTTIKAPAPERISLDSTLSVPTSELNVPIFYPVAELENMANEKLNSKVIDANIPISKGDDTLHLSISRFRSIKLTYDGDRGLTYSLPFQIDGYLDSKVIGIHIRNKEPMRAKIIITLFSDLYLDENWDLAPKTELKNIEWVEEPKIKVAGIKINLKPSIQNALEKNKDKIVAKLDESAKSIVKIHGSIEKLWGDLQKPIRINRKVVGVWLKADATDLDGRIYPISSDTLAIEAGLKAHISTTLDSAASIKTILPFPKLKRQINAPPGLHAYALVRIPFDAVNKVVSQVTDTMILRFKGHSVRIKESEVYGTKDGIAIRVSIRGDLDADVFLKGTIGFDSLGKKLQIENFGFDVNSELSLVNAADWFAHDELIDRLRPYLSIPLDKVFDAIPSLITKGIEKGNLGSKINVNFSEFDLSLYQHLITTKDIQIIAMVKGGADVELQNALFNKKKPRLPG